MLTNYVIAKDNRFHAATSGAGISNILSGFGHDHYIREYVLELGTPWDNLDTWLNVSHPFFNADEIVTPTLFFVNKVMLKSTPACPDNPVAVTYGISSNPDTKLCSMYV